MALITTNTKQEFEDKVLKSDKVVLVDFWAAWCGPCLAMAPRLDEIAKEQDDIADVVKVNVEESRDNGMLANEYGVRSIPNMVMFKGGKEVDRIIGVTPKPVLVEKFKIAHAK